MTEEQAVAGQTTQLEITKRIVPFDEDNPSIEPLFINCAQGAFLGDDIYLDVGVITLESVDPKTNAKGTGEFAVISRLVMSRRTAILARDQLDFVLRREEKTSGESSNASS